MNPIPSITCPKCHWTSHNANDIAQGYCGHCHDWTTPVPPVCRTPEAKCPSCHQPLSAVLPGNAPAGVKPRPNDFTLCMHCGDILLFNENMTTRAADLNDMVKLPPFIHDQLRAAQLAVRKHRPMEDK